MKIAVISDIHGNVPALHRVAEDIEAWQPDLVVVAGDVVSRGPLSLDCLQFVQKKQSTDGWQVVRGNHEEYILEWTTPGSSHSGPKFEIQQFAYWAYRQLNGQAELLAEWPYQFSYSAADGTELRVVHGSMRGIRDGIYPNTTDDTLREQIVPAPKVFVTAHTHRPLMRRVDDTLVVNVGSVGAPFDQDRRLSYGRFTWSPSRGWEAKITRLDYDWEQTIRDYVRSGFLTEAGPLAQLMLVELRRSGGLIFRWADRYQEAVLAGEMSLADSVREILKDDDLRPYVGAPGWTL